MKKNALSLCLYAAAVLFLPNFTYAEESQYLSLKQAIELTVRNSPEVLSAEQEVKLAKHRVRDAKFQFAPQISLSGTATHFKADAPIVSGPELGNRFFLPNTYGEYSDYLPFKKDVLTARVEILQPLYEGGRNVNNLRLAKVAHNRAQVNYAALKSSKSYEAKQAYFKLQYLRLLRASAKKTFAEIESKLEYAATSLSDKYEISVQTSLMQSKVREIEMLEQAAVSEMLTLISRDPLFTFTLDEDFSIIPVDVPLSQCFVAATEHRAELQNEIFQAQTDQIAVNMAIMRNYPTIMLGAVYDLNASSFSELSKGETYSKNWLAMLSVRLPFSYNSWSTVSQSRMQQRQGELKRIEIQNSIKLEITNAYREAQFWENEYSILDGQMKKAETLYQDIINSSPSSAAAVRYGSLIIEIKQKQLESIYRQRQARARLELARGLDF
ncbi:MAG: TolC family protein [Elusimicrobiales bacterium]|nr:TolC family protein [Elusimicrobiales bacterium]